MHLSEIFIRRPIATSLLMAGIALFGVVASLVPETESERAADHDAQPHLQYAAAVGARRLRRSDDRAAHLDGERRVAGAGTGRVEIRGACAARPGQASRAAHRPERSRS